MTALTWVLALTDGTTTVTFTTAPKFVLEFPITGPSGQLTTTEQFRYAEQVAAATALANVRVIERLLAQAKRYQEKFLGNPVYLQFTEFSGGDIYRSEILEGMVEWDRETLGGLYAGDAAIVTIVYTRLNFWEANTEAQLALVNGNEATPGTPTTDALPVFNCGDGLGTTPAENRDWVEIAAAAVGGDLPAPVRIEFENETAGTPRNDNHYIGHALLPDPDSLPHILEAENADGATPVVEAANSEGEYANYTLTSSEATAFTWTLTDAQMDAFGGSRVQPFIRLRVATLFASATKLRLQLIYQSLVIWQQRFQTTMNLTDNLQMVGSPIQIPPDFLGADLQSLGLRLTATRAAGGTLSVDYLKLMPLDSFARLTPKVTYGLAKDETLVIDGISHPPRTYILVGGDKVGQYTPGYGVAPLHVWPNALQRFYFAWDSTDGTSSIAKTAGVKIFYRPRRRTL